MITGQELYELLQSQGPGFFWVAWERLGAEYRGVLGAVAEILNDRQAEHVHEALAGEDI